MDRSGISGTRDYNNHYGANQYNQPHSRNQPQQHQMQYMHQQNQFPQNFSRQPTGHHTFQLNPNAAVFVPRNEAYMQQQSQYQFNDYSPYNNRMQNYGGNQQPPNYQNYASNQNMAYYDRDDEAAYEAMYSQFGYEMCSAQYIPSSDLQYSMSNSSNKTELNEILVGLEQLISDGDDFDSWSLAIRDRMASREMTSESRSVALKVICEMATALSTDVMKRVSPQYTFARLISYLADEITGLHKDILMVLNNCHDGRGLIQESDRKCNLLMFFAEVYVKLSTSQGNPIKALGDGLLEQIEEMVKTKESVNNENMKTIINVMKLAGADLDSSNSGENKMNTILTMLSGFAKGHPQLSETVKSLMSDLLDLRRRGWGRVSRAAGASAPAGAIVDPDGKVIDLSEEERMFLESQFDNIGKAFNTQESHDSSIDDSDILEEFGDFVKEERLRTIQNKAKLIEDEKTTTMLENLSVKETGESVKSGSIDNSDDKKNPASQSKDKVDK